jgi:hypothetical protein
VMMQVLTVRRSRPCRISCADPPRARPAPAD